MEKFVIWTVAFSSILPLFVFGLPEVIKIGGLFDVIDRYEETAFRHAIERLNSDPNILPRSKLVGAIERLPIGDSFHASKKVCSLLNDGIVSVFGPQTPASSSHIQSVCEVLEIPHIETKWDFRSTPRNYLFNLYPPPALLSQAYADLIDAWGWDKYVIIYENNESLVRLQDILKGSVPYHREANVKQLPSDDDYRPLFKDIRIHTDITNIIIDCGIEKLPTILDHARQVGMMSQYYKYFLTTLDIQAVNLENFMRGDVNITSFRMIDPQKAEVQNLVRLWENLVHFGFQNKSSEFRNIYVDEAISSSRTRSMRPNRGEPIPPLPNNMITTEIGLLYDGVELVGRALHALDSSQERIDMKPVSCSTPHETSPSGFILSNALGKIQFEGLTGIIEFDGTGSRNHLQLDILEFTQKGLVKIGSWDSNLKEKFFWTRTAEETLKQQEEDLKDKTLIVTTKLSNPYCMDPHKNGSFEGYAIDVIHLIAESLQFNYEIKLVKDNRYGNPNNKTKHGWDGMIGEILAGEADIAIADLTINYDRERTVDFTMPFMNLGISILYKKPKKNPPSLFSFLEPFHFDVWIYMATAYLGVSLILFILARFTPSEWQDPPPCSKDAGELLENPFGNMINSLWFCMGSLLAQGCDFLPKISPLQWVNPHPCKPDPEELENDLNLSNCMWHNWGSLMQQGSDIAPKAGSTRMVAGIWWFFTLIMISSYTANLAAFLTKEGLEGGVNDIKDLPKQTKVKYGSVGSGTTAAFFRDSTFPLYKEIWNNMQNMKPSPFVESTKEGMERVDKSGGEYAFFMESSSIEYVTERNCDLTQIGGLLDSKGYGIALRKYSKYREAFSGKVLELQERGELEKLKIKWWKEKGGGVCNVEVASTGGAQALTLAHVGGVFVVLLGGCAMACIMALIEFLWKSRKLGQNEGESLWDEMMKELRFALQCQGDKKPVRRSNTEQSMDGSARLIGGNERREPSQ